MNVLRMAVFSLLIGLLTTMLVHPAMAQTLSLQKTQFNPGETIVVTFAAPGPYPGNAWIGIIPSNVPHGNESENDKYDLAYQYIKQRTSGTMSFKAPAQPGAYDFRMHDTDSGGVEVASVSFAVGASSVVPAPAPAPVQSSAVKGRFITVPAATVPAGQAIDIQWHNAPGNSQDWITVAPANSSDKEWGAWAYLGGKTSGIHRVSGLGPGKYEARIYWNWPAGGYKVQERVQFQVAGAGGTVAAQPEAGNEVRGRYMTLPKAVYGVGETVDVYWHNTPGYAQDWITVSPARASDKKWGVWSYLKGRTSGVHRVRGLGPGHYEARIYWNWPAGAYKVQERLPFVVR